MTVSLADINDFNIIFAIMEKSFPIDEFRDAAEQKALFRDERYKIFKAELNGELAAFIAVWTLKRCCFIEHLATNENMRNMGIGAKLLNDVLSRLKMPVCLEVEPPETDIARRRINFYLRNGFAVNDYPYMQPPLRSGLVPRKLIVLSQPALSFSEFSAVKRELYTSVYDFNGEL